MSDLDPRDNEIAKLGHDIFWLKRELEKTQRALVKERDRANDLHDQLTEMQANDQDRMRILR